MIKSLFASKLNPNEISLAIQGTARAVITVIVAFAGIKGIDVLPVVDNIKIIADQAVVIVSAGVAVWHAGVAVWGFVRKFMVVTPVTGTTTS